MCGIIIRYFDWLKVKVNSNARQNSIKLVLSVIGDCSVGIATSVRFAIINLSIFPSVTKDLWGIKHFGTNYGLLFTAWGVGGFVMGRLSQMLNVATNSFSTSFLTAGILLLLGATLTFFLKSDVKDQRPALIKLKVAPEPVR